MLGLLLDAAVICGIAFLLNQGETQGFGTGVASAFAIGIAVFLCAKFVSIWLAIAVLVAMTFLVFWAVFGLTPLKAAAGTGIVLAYKVALVVMFIFLL